MTIPEGLRDVIGRRLSRLSPECNRLLAVAAVIGRDFGLDTLQTIAGLEEEAVVSALEEALHVGVLEEQSRLGVIRYRFAHAFFRQTLYEELIAPRRLRLHQQVAAALERQYANRLEEHAAELAEHFAQSTDRDDLAKAVRYGELAAVRAIGVYAYGEAVRHLAQALDVQEVLDPDDKLKRCDLLLTLGEALLPAGELLRAAEQVAPQALELAEALDDRRRASWACQLACTSLLVYGGTMTGTPIYRQWVERADRYAAEGTVERVYADLALGHLRNAQGRPGEALPLFTAALAQARQGTDIKALFEAAGALIRWYAYMAPPALMERETALLLAEEFCSRPRVGVQATTLSTVLGNSAALYCDAGDRARAEDARRQQAELGERMRDASTLLSIHANEVSLALLDGDVEGAAAAAARLPGYGDELGAPVNGRQLAAGRGFRPRQYLNRLEEALVALPEATALAGMAEAQGQTSRFIRARTALSLASLGRSAEARALLAEALAELSGGDEWQAATGDTAVLLEAAVLLADREAAARLVAQLVPAASSAWCGNALTCAARHLGAASALLGEREQAMRYYEQALEVCGRLRFRPELALTHLGIAELLLDDGVGGRVSGIGEETGTPLSLAGEGQGEGETRATASTRAEAMRHLDIAIAELREMKMQPALERALRHKDVLKA